MLEKYKALRSAESYVVNGKYGHAIKEYRRLLEQEGDDPGLLNTFGDLLLKNGERDEALSTFNRVSDMYTESGFVTKAVAVCKKVRQLKPTDTEASERLADLYLRQGLAKQAAALLEEAVDEHQEWGRTEDALRGLEKLVQVEETPAARRQMAVLHLQAEQPEEAAGHFDRAAQLYGERGSMEEAQECLKEARRLGLEPTPLPSPAPEDPATAETEETGSSAETVDSEEASGGEPEAGPEQTSEAPLDNSGAVLTTNGREGAPEAPPAAADAPFEVVGNDLTARSESAGGAFDLGDGDDFEVVDNQVATWDMAADESVDEAPAGLEPWDGPVDEALEEADFYLKLGLHEDARNVLGRLLLSFPEDERVLRRAEKARLPLPEQTVPEVGEPSDDGEDSFEMEVDLALDVLFEGNDEGAPQEVLRYEVSRDERVHDENDPKVHYDLGLAYKEMGLTEDSVEKFKQAYELFEDPENEPQRVLCCSMLANAFLQLGNHEEAVEWARRGLDLPGKREFEWKALQYDACQAMEQLGEAEEALTGYRSISERDPDYRDVGARINELSLQIGHD